MKKIIFLDLDGVLNHESFFRSSEYNLNKELLQNDPAALNHQQDIDPKAVVRLNKLLDDTGAEVVVSSTWRRQGKTFVNSILRNCGLRQDILDITPISKCPMCLRGNEILYWLKENKNIIGVDAHSFRHYVIFDDDSDFLYWQRNNLIIVNPEFGLSKRDVYKATQILNTL